MRAQILLADHAVVESGKLYVHGGGWNSVSFPMGPVFVAGLIFIPWGRTNNKIKFVLHLLDEDGGAVTVEGPSGSDDEVRAGAIIEVGRPPGAVHGDEFVVPFVFGFAPLPLAPGGYAFQADLDGETDPDWRASFRVSQG